MNARTKGPSAEREAVGASTSYPFQSKDDAADRRIARLYEESRVAGVDPVAALQSALKQIPAFSVGPAEQLDLLKLVTGREASGDSSQEP